MSVSQLCQVRETQHKVIPQVIQTRWSKHRSYRTGAVQHPWARPYWNQQTASLCVRSVSIQDQLRRHTRYLVRHSSKKFSLASVPHIRYIDTFMVSCGKNPLKVMESTCHPLEDRGLVVHLQVRDQNQKPGHKSHVDELDKQPSQGTGVATQWCPLGHVAHQGDISSRMRRWLRHSVALTFVQPQRPKQQKPYEAWICPHSQYQPPWVQGRQETECATQPN